MNGGRNPKLDQSKGVVAAYGLRRYIDCTIPISMDYTWRIRIDIYASVAFDTLDYSGFASSMKPKPKLILVFYRE